MRPHDGGAQDAGASRPHPAVPLRSRSVAESAPVTNPTSTNSPVTERPSNRPYSFVEVRTHFIHLHSFFSIELDKPWAASSGTSGSSRLGSDGPTQGEPSFDGPATRGIRCHQTHLGGSRLDG